MPYWISPRSAFSGQLSQDRLKGTEKQANQLCQLSLSIKALSLSPSVGQTWQRMCRKVYLSGRLQDTQPSSVLLPDPLPEPGELLQCSSFETPSTAWEETQLHGAWAAVDRQRGSLPSDLDERLWKTFNDGQLLSQNRAGQRTGMQKKKRLPWSKPTPCAVPGLTQPCVGQHTYSFFIVHKEEHPPHSSFGTGRSNEIMKGA